MGSNFDLKEFFDEFPKVMSEFEKRIDPDLPFFYWTVHQTCYRVFDYPPSMNLQLVVLKDWTK